MNAELKKQKAEVRRRCCQDLRRYLETALKFTKGGVISVKLSRVLAVGRAHIWKRHYAWCLSRLLRKYKFGDGLYVLTRQQAEELLGRLDALCAQLRTKLDEEGLKKPAPPHAAPVAVDDMEGMPMVTFHVPRTLLQALDEYARRMNMTRSDVVRMAISQLLNKIRAAKEEATEEQTPLLT